MIMILGLDLIAFLAFDIEHDTLQIQVASMHKARKCKFIHEVSNEVL